MFRLLSKESNIFSVPVYAGVLFLAVVFFNIFNFSILSVISAVLSFSGITLGLFLFNKMGLTYSTHLPLFLYTLFVFAFYPLDMDFGLSAALLVNSLLLLVLTNSDENIRKNSFLGVGALIAVNYLVLPSSWPLVLFAIFHLVATSDRPALNIFRFFLGFALIICSYLGMMYFFHQTTFNKDFFLFEMRKPVHNFYPVLLLSPIALLLLLAVAGHFRHYNEKSPEARYKYTFLLVYGFAQLVIVVLYMGSRHEFLLFLALPAAIMLSRYLRFLPKYWMQEVGLWLIIFTLVIFKVGNFFDAKNFF